MIPLNHGLITIEDDDDADAEPFAHDDSGALSFKRSQGMASHYSLWWQEPIPRKTRQIAVLVRRLRLRAACTSWGSTPATLIRRLAVIWGQSLEEQPQDKPLNSSQRSRLAKCERIIEKGLGTFVVMGKALAQIRNERLYRETHPTFEAYCQQRWALTARRARQLTDAAEIVRNLEGSAEDETSDTMGTIVPIVTPDKRVACCVLPTSERQVRPLSRLGYRQQREVWQKVVEASQGVPSEQQVEKIRDAMFPQSKSKPKKAPSQKREVEEEQEPMGAQVPLDNSAEVHQEPVEPKPYQPLLDFLQDLKANPGNYDFDISIDDHELMTSYGQVRARLLRLIEALELAVT